MAQRSKTGYILTYMAKTRQTKNSKDSKNHLVLLALRNSKEQDKVKMLYPCDEDYILFLIDSQVGRYRVLMPTYPMHEQICIYISYVYMSLRMSTEI